MYDSQQGLKQLRRMVYNYQDPESVRLLENKVDKEKMYLQRTIIQMELKQLAESLGMITHKRRLKRPADTNPEFTKNRPLLWHEKIEEDMRHKQEKKKF